MNLTLLATVDDCSSVADQVHWLTIVVAVRPMLTCKDFFCLYVTVKNDSLDSYFSSGVKCSVEIVCVVVNVPSNLRFIKYLFNKN